MAYIDPEAVMAQHRNESTTSWPQSGYAKFYCWGCQVDSDELCLPYRLAEDLATEQAKVARVKALARVSGGTSGRPPSGIRVVDIHAALTDPPTPDPYLRSIDA